MKNQSITNEMLDVLNRDYPRQSVNRVDAERFGNQQRGNALLVMGRYRTEAEQESFIRESLAIELPFSGTK
jgi:hypothetical protein